MKTSWMIGFTVVGLLLSIGIAIALAESERAWRRSQAPERMHECIVRCQSMGAAHWAWTDRAGCTCASFTPNGETR